MDSIAIIGAGDLGRQIAHYVRHDKKKVIGFFDDTLPTGTYVNDLPVLGGLDAIVSMHHASKFDSLLLGIGYKHMNFRKTVFHRFRDIPFASFVHSSVLMDSTVKIGEGSIVFPGCLLDKGVVVQENVLINVHATISHDTVIEAHSFISPRVALAGFVTVGERCILGINCVVIDNIAITAQSQLGAGAVVTKSILKKGLYVGVPAKLK